MIEQLNDVFVVYGLKCICLGVESRRRTFVVAPFPPEQLDRHHPVVVGVVVVSGTDRSRTNGSRGPIPGPSGDGDVSMEFDAAPGWRSRSPKGTT